jgi:hypothetical protein
LAGMAALLLLAGSLEIHGSEDLHLAVPSSLVGADALEGAPEWRSEAAAERSPCHACLHRLQSQGLVGRPVAPSVLHLDQGYGAPLEGPGVRQLGLIGRHPRGPPLHFGSLV